MPLECLGHQLIGGAFVTAGREPIDDDEGDLTRHGRSLECDLHVPEMTDDLEASGA
jgi:hypothetical protein